MPRTLKLILAYDGTDFHGWQAQAGCRTVQGEINQLAQRILREPVAVVGASRTDAGVHARGQVAHVVTQCALQAERLFRALGARLPEDVTLVALTDAHTAFHAIRDARRKLYRYRIHNAVGRPDRPGALRYAWHVWHALDPERMAAGAALLAGTHDFTSFAGSNSPRTSNVRTIHRFEVSRNGAALRLDVAGDGFLYNQVRNMVGTLVEIGRGHWAVERLREILAARQRAAAGPTAPAHGLCLEWVRYDPPPGESACNSPAESS